MKQKPFFSSKHIRKQNLEAYSAKKAEFSKDHSSGGK